MPCGHGMTGNNTEKLVDRGSCPLSKRYFDQKYHKFYSKGRRGPTPVLRNSEERCITLTLFILERNARKFLSPFPLLSQGSDMRNHLDSEADVNRDGLESSSPPVAIVFEVDLPKGQRINSSDFPDSAKSFSSSGANVLGHPNRSKWIKSVKNSSRVSLPSSIVSNNFSRLDCEDSDIVGSDFLVNNNPKVDKPVKRMSRKKGKKKRKHYKKSMHKKVSPLSETQCGHNICDASVSGASVSSDTACTSAHNSQRGMSEKVHSGDEVSCNQLGMDEGSNHLSIKSSSTQSPEIIRSTSDENITDAHPIQNGIDYDISTSILFDQNNSPMVDSVLDIWQIDISGNSSNDVETQSSIKVDDGFNPSKCGIVLDARNSDTSFCSITEDTHDQISDMSTNYYSTKHNFPKDVDIVNSTERAQCSSQACSSNDFQLVVNRKRGRLIKKSSQSLNGIHRFDTANMHDWRGRDNNNNSIWKRVQKNNTQECICAPKKVNFVSPRVEISSIGSEAKATSDIFVGLKQNGTGNSCAYTSSEVAVRTDQTDLIKVSSNNVVSSELSKAIEERHDVPEKLKRKPRSASKQGSHYSPKGFHTDKTNMDKPKVQDKGLELLSQATHQQCISIGLKSSGRSDFRSDLVMSTNKVECCQSGPHYKTQINVEEDAPPEKVGSMACGTPSQDAENLISLFAMASNTLDHTHINVHSDSGKDMHDDHCLFTDSEDKRYLKSGSECSHADNSKLDSTFIPVLQKWVPVGEKESVFVNMSRTCNLTASVANESIPDSSNSKNEEVEILSSSCHHSLQMSDEVACLRPCFEEASSEADELTRCHPHTYGEYGGVLAISDHCLTHKAKDQCLPCFETDSDKIVQAVNDSYKLQTASEGVHLVTGSPVAEFERFLHSASPVLNHIYCVRSCETCFPDQLSVDALCQHQIPNISLGSFWQWYEKHGSYGMEVKVEDYYNSNRYCNGQFEFRAYFVPYLSAMQLFGWSRSYECANNGDPRELVMEACEVGMTSTSSSYSTPFPSLSVPLSQPRNEPDACFSKLSSSAKEEVCNQSARNTQLGDEELLFEYFEAEPPQQRRPLFEKIKELVRGDALSNCQISGRSKNLEDLNLPDLHPASWYSVAWYPIYRIPDGNFRAAFLTYHSLGHFVRAVSRTPGGVARLVSPVVGLQSYNAKGECWFRPRSSKSRLAETGAAAAMSSDPSEILKERLRTLERTASVMATASVRKGGLRSVNRQPDYEFFVSRGR